MKCNTFQKIPYFGLFVYFNYMLVQQLALSPHKRQGLDG